MTTHIIHILFASTFFLVLASANNEFIQSPPHQQSRMKRRLHKFVPEIDYSECIGGTFCHQAQNYPTQEINALLAQQKVDYSRYRGTTLVPIEEITMVNRFGGEERNMCSTFVSKAVPPTLLQNFQDREKKYIIQNENITQLVHVELCREAGAECFSGCPGLANGYTTFCKQQEVLATFLSVGADKIIGPDLFILPHTCACYYS